MKLPRFNEDSYAHFITTNTFGYKSIFKNIDCCRILLKNIDFYRNKIDFKLIGYVIMPDHFHCLIWWNSEKLPKLTISIIMHRLKGRSAKMISDYILSGRQGFYALPDIHRGIKASITQKGRLSTRDAIKIWHPSFYDFNIYSEEKLRQKLNYIHLNPVRAGLVNKPEDYPYSSYRNYYLDDEKIIKIDRLFNIYL